MATYSLAAERWLPVRLAQLRKWFAAAASIRTKTAGADWAASEQPHASAISL